MGLDSALKKLSAHLASAYRLRYATLPELKKRKLELRVARPGTRVVIPQLLPRDAARGESWDESQPPPHEARTSIAVVCGSHRGAAAIGARRASELCSAPGSRSST
jgi:hypothetical protein